MSAGEDEEADGLVDLRRVERDAHRDADVLARLRVGERDGPGLRALGSPAAAGGEAADAADGLAERDARGRGVGEGEERDLLDLDEEDGGHERAEEASVEDAAGPEELEEAAEGA